MLEQKKISQEVLLSLKNQEDLAQLAQFFKSETAPVKLISHNGQETSIPESIYRLLQQIFQAMESGRAVSVIPPENLVTTQKAAKIIKISHPNLLKLLEAGKISCVEVNAEVKVALEDLIDYKNKQHDAREKLLDEVMEISQSAGFYE